MCAAMYQQLQEWARDSAVHAVLIDAAPGRAFCAGGDIRAIYQMGRENMAAAEAFFATEYRLNAAIRHFAKPYVALINGVTMGGGVSVITSTPTDENPDAPIIVAGSGNFGFVATLYAVLDYYVAQNFNGQHFVKRRLRSVTVTFPPSVAPAGTVVAPTVKSTGGARSTRVRLE